MYHAVTESGEDRAIKVYKTSILVFKDRDRYVSGEFRFRHGYSRHNPRQMVKVWAEKEMRNLKRCVPARVRGGPRADSSSRHGSAAARRARRLGPRAPAAHRGRPPRLRRGRRRLTRLLPPG